MNEQTETQEQTAEAVVDEKPARTAIEAMAAGSATVPALFVPQSMGELMRFSELMAVTTFVPKHLRNKSADCLAVAMQAYRWEMDPFAVANKTYFVNDRIAFEAQLINAVVNTRAPLEERLKVDWAGVGEELECTVTGTLKGDSEPKVRNVKIKGITTRNSPLWKQDPEQQLAYYATRQWARLYCPEVLLGVYAPDEIPPRGPEHARDVTPAEPQRTDYRADLHETVEELAKQNIRAFDIFDHFGEGLGVFTAGPWIDRFAELAMAAAKDGTDALVTFTENNAGVAAQIREEGLVTEPAMIGEAIDAATKSLQPAVIDVEAQGETKGQPEAEEEETVDDREEHLNGDDLTTDEIAGATPTEENAAPAEETAEPDTPSLESLITTGKLNADEGWENLGIWWKGLGGTLQNIVGGPELDRLKARAREADTKIAAAAAAATQDEIPFDGDK